jgi:hypothetical protein
MLLETAQIIYTALSLITTTSEMQYLRNFAPHSLNGKRGYDPIKNAKHPIVLWCASSFENCKYACIYGLYLCKEFYSRFGKSHASAKQILWVSKVLDSTFIQNKFKYKNFTVPPKCFGEEKDLQSLETKSFKDLVILYRHYYIRKLEKNLFLKYSRISEPKIIPKWKKLYSQL